MAAASIDITPDKPVPLAGYVRRRERYEAVSDRLEANVLVLRSGDDLLLFVCLDLLYAGNELRRRIEDCCRTVVAPERLIVAASHTHFAPATDPSLPRLGAMDGTYFSFIAAAIEKGVTGVLKSASVPVRLQRSEGTADHAINRRRAVFGIGRDFPFLKTRWMMRPNPRGPRDETIRVIRFIDLEGATRAVCWSYGCHPVAYPRSDNVSADFPGVVRASLRERFGDIPVLFLQGFSGDVRPCDFSGGQRWESADRFSAFGESEWQSWSGTLATRVRAIADLQGDPVEGPLATKRVSVSLREFGPDAGERPIAGQHVGIGDLDIVGLSIEVASDYLEPLAARFGRRVVPVGCLDGVPGYLPTSEMVPQGGYEAADFMDLFGVSGRYRDDVSARVSSLVFDELAISRPSR